MFGFSVFAHSCAFETLFDNPQRILGAQIGPAKKLYNYLGKIERQVGKLDPALIFLAG